MKLELIDSRKVLHAPEGYDTVKVQSALKLLSQHKRPKVPVRFDNQLGRDMSPSIEYSDQKSLQKGGQEHVSHSTFLPNYIKNSPLTRDYSQTYKTVKYNLSS